jgi:hypothetical protein
MFRIEHNAETGEIKQIELSAAEVKQLEKEYAENKVEQEKLEAEAEAKEAAKAALLRKLGITAEEAALLLS